MASVRNFGALTSLSLAATVLFIAGCGSGNLTAPPKPTLAPESVQPTFVRITVTPQPTSTPTPTPTPTATTEPYEIDFGEPVFPLDLDPEQVDEKPDDDVIIAGWTRYLTNTSIDGSGADTPLQFCSGGRVLTENGPHFNLENWRVVRSPAISANDWGTVSVEVDVLKGRRAGQPWDVMTLVRKVGKVFITNIPTPTEAVVVRSEICLANQ